VFAKGGQNLTGHGSYVAARLTGHGSYVAARLTGHGSYVAVRLTGHGSYVAASSVGVVLVGSENINSQPMYGNDRHGREGCADVIVRNTMGIAT
jgi:uncharacterized secreted protein with C-terminal beta-propeller domain